MSPMRLLSLCTVLVITAGGCASPEFERVAIAGAAALTAGGPEGLLRCRGTGGPPANRPVGPDSNVVLGTQGQQLAVRPGMVAEPVTLRMEVPASPFMHLRIYGVAPGGQEEPVGFDPPAELTVFYGRCSNGPVPGIAVYRIGADGRFERLRELPNQPGGPRIAVYVPGLSDFVIGLPN